MLLHSPRIRSLVCLLLIACCACSRLWAAKSVDEPAGGKQQSDILAPSDHQPTAVLAKNVADVFRLTRRDLVADWWQPVIGRSADSVSTGCTAHRHWSSHQILSEFARREVAGVLLS